MASLTMISNRPLLMPQSACRGLTHRTPAFTTTRPRHVFVRAEKKQEMSDDEAKELGKQAVNKGGNAYIDELPVSLLVWCWPGHSHATTRMSTSQCMLFAAAHPQE